MTQEQKETVLKLLKMGIEEGISIAKKHRKFDFDPETMIATTTYDTDSIKADKEAYLLWVEKQLNEEFGGSEE